MDLSLRYPLNWREGGMKCNDSVVSDMQFDDYTETRDFIVSHLFVFRRKIRNI